MSLSATELRVFLEGELSTLKTLSEVIDEEFQALKSSDGALLESITGRKNKAIEAHRTQQQRRLDWMNAAALALDTPLPSLVQKAGDEADLHRLRDELTTLAEATQSNNRRNGGLIVRLQERTQGALNVLRNEDSAKLYSISGARETHTDGRSLGKA